MPTRTEWAELALQITDDVRHANESSLVPVGVGSLTTAVECLAKALLEPIEEVASNADRVKTIAATSDTWVTPRVWRV